MIDKTTCSKCGYSTYTYLNLVDGVPMCKSCKSKAEHPHWPRGKYNGQRILGGSLKTAIRLDGWYWRPTWNKYAQCFRWLCFYVWVEAVYE